ncbi:DUF1684 domain-containing protein [Halobaculum sp. CBA1158]|uniref:DUF1684 domain-containing protein n=1 Tax=Halobaculum sp. CBA1158 TaxID=2904243 RepID=UPI001F47E124|nr:DUF1684 domain-containing protein [Halobaculum sp. CBA1158]UIO99476.1 DUF1684 domain-containing protein [Halobaculum sp. CBA1158]
MTDDNADAADADSGVDPDDEWVSQLREMRAEKDEFFASDPQSPLDPAHSDGFDGLDYFDPNPAYRVEADVTVHDDLETTELTVRNGTAERFHEVATLSFTVPTADGDAVEETLSALRAEGSRALFLPFRDKTTGQQTYDGGRYMDLHPKGDLADVDAVTLDFNLAYTPFCAFSDAFACPLPPTENWLDVAVPAGERTPDLE